MRLSQSLSAVTITRFVFAVIFSFFYAPVAKATTYYVNAGNPAPVAPYTSWATAATNIQDAIAQTVKGDTVLVTNGLYNVGGKSMDGLITNRVSIDKAILVQSVNGPTATIIQGAWDPISTNGPGAVRCVWMTNNAILSGFTVCGGATRESTVSGGSSGGGVMTVSTNSTIYNCVLATNFASRSGGGVCAAGIGLNPAHTTVIGCTFIGNQAGFPGQPFSGNGGGAEKCSLQSCILLNNSANQGYGGGADNCNLRNCALIGNSANFDGGGANSGTLVNCTVISNTSSGYSSGYGAAVYGATLTNCIVIGNFSRTSFSTNYASCTLAYCCADPLPSGPGNMDVNPQVLADGFHLAQASPCIGAGISNVVLGTDIDSQPWTLLHPSAATNGIPRPSSLFNPYFKLAFRPMI